ncbi:hypothetical protein PUN28_017741 [Cardiocondyla obscurior]|uniref:Uncharacterized protein n=1 Tax=Cardiocondyla obscurior TaxID=286306 RepID=A0AAW2EL68_9HYME
MGNDERSKVHDRKKRERVCKSYLRTLGRNCLYRTLLCTFITLMKCREEKIIQEKKKGGRGRRPRESKDLACNNVPGKSIPVKLGNQESRKQKAGGVSVPSIRRSREKPQVKSLRKKRRVSGELYRNFPSP